MKNQKAMPSERLSLLFSPSVSFSIMAFRRALSLSSTLFSHHRHRLLTTTSSSYSQSSLLQTLSSSSQPPLQIPLNKPHSQTQTLLVHHRGFHTTAFFFRQHQLNDNTNDKLDPDTILFEGCDYKHWLIVMDFPNDPQQRPPADQMIDTYVQTLANVLASVEEAKKKIYACSTTIYTGFQAEIDEETANKMEGLPGVLFVLPDSYIDPVNKEYGGDKYINGNIIPRPPPVQYGRVRRGRSTDQRPRGPMQNQQANPAYNQHPPDGRGYTPQQGFSQQPPPQGFSQQQGFPQQQSFSPQQGLPPQPGVPPQQGFRTLQGFLPSQGFSHQQGYPQQQRVPQPQQSYVPQGQGGRENSLPGAAHPAGGRDTYHGGGGNSFSYQGNHSHGYPRRQMDNHSGDNENYTPHVNYNSAQPGRGAFGQTGIGSYDQSVAGQYGAPPTGTHGQGPGSGYGPGYRPHRENQGFVQTPDEHNNISLEHRNNSPAGHTGTNHGRY